MELRVRNSSKCFMTFFKIFLVLMPLEYIMEYYATHGALFLIMKNLIKFCIPIMLVVCTAFMKKHFTVYSFLVSCVICINIVFSLITSGTANITYVFLPLYILIAALTYKILQLDDLLNVGAVYAVIGILLFCYAFIFIGFDTSKIIGREWSGYSWSESFYFISYFWMTPYFVCLSVIKNRYKKLAMVEWIVYIIFNLFMLKRYVIVDSLLMIACLFINGNKAKIKMSVQRLVKPLVVGTAAVMVAQFVFKDQMLGIVQSLVNRFTSVGSVGDFDRFVEAQRYFENTSFIKVIFGGGFLNTHTSLGYMMYDLHIGWADFVFKGGLVLLMCIVFPVVKAFYLLKKYNRFSNRVKYSILTMIMFTGQMLYSNTHSFRPQLFLLFYSCFIIMDKKEYIGK